MPRKKKVKTEAEVKAAAEAKKAKEEGEFSQLTKDKLQKLNAYRCANPDCRQYTLANKIDGGLYTTGEAAHIEGNAVKAARYNALSNPEKRADISNALWLCTRCHSMVDPDENRFPVSLLLKWKDMSENILNYSAPIMSFGNRCFFYGKSPWPPGPSALGGHLTIGPTNLDGICTECWIEGLSSEGRFRLEADRFYENANTGEALKVVIGDDWHPFLTRSGMDRLTYFSGSVPGYLKFLAYRVGVSYQILGRDFLFHSPWQLGALTRFKEEIFHFNRKTGTLLAPWIDWVFANAELPDAKKMLLAFGHDSLHVRHYTWSNVLERNPDNALVWNSDERGVETCLGGIDNEVTFGFIQEGIQTALVVSTKSPPTDQLIAGDKPSQVIIIE
jgi:hypothetical protein